MHPNTNSSKRNKNDFYQTPYSMVWQLLERESLPGSILEPACGSGAIVKALSSRYTDIISYDLSTGKDFLLETNLYDTVITNPPYSIANEFILAAKKVARQKIVFITTT